MSLGELNVKVKIGWEAILAIAVVGGLGYVAYKFWKGDWKLPNIGDVIGDIAPRLDVTPLKPSELVTYAKDVTQGRGILSSPYDFYMGSIGLLPKLAATVLAGPAPAPAIFPAETMTAIVAKYADKPGFGEAGISIALGSEFQKRTGRYLPQ